MQRQMPNSSCVGQQMSRSSWFRSLYLLFTNYFSILLFTYWMLFVSFIVTSSLCLQLTKFVFGTIFLRESWPCLTVWFLPAHSTFFLQLLHFHFSNLFMRILEPRKWTLYTNDNLFALLKCWFHIIVMMTFISVFGWEKPNLGGKKMVQIENWILEPV
jgi:hypothetical protein